MSYMSILVKEKKTMSNVIKVTRKTHCKRKIIIKCHI